MNKEINLIRSKSQTPFAALFDRITIIRVIAFGMLMTVSALSVSFFLLVSFSPLPNLKREEQEKLTQLRALGKKKGVLLGVQDRLNNIKKLLASRTDIAELIQVVNENASGPVRLSSFSIEDKTVKLQVESNSLDEMDVFLGNMSKKQSIAFSQVVMDGISLDQNRGRYIASISIQL